MVTRTAPLDAFGQHPRLNGVYTQLCFLFPLDTSSHGTKEEIERHLRNGLERLVQHVPWVGGQVVPSRNGYREISFTGASPALTVKDLEQELTTYDAMRQAGFPFSMPDEKVIARLPTLPKDPKAVYLVFVLQANFVQGGLLLVFNAQHSCMDLRGEVQLIELFAKACRGDSFADEEVEVANMTEYKLESPTKARPAEGKPEPPKSTARAQPGAKDSQDSQKATWSLFRFSSTDLGRLKNIASKDKSCDFISTDDALSALLWQAMHSCRSARLTSDNTTSTLERQVNARKFVGAPHAYMGNMVYKTTTRLPVDEVATLSLGQLASHLRRELTDTAAIEREVRDSAKKMQDMMESGKPLQASAQREALPVTNIRLSSWAQENCCDFDFGGPLGLAEAIRRPSFEAWEGLAYFLPKSREGDIMVAVCLRDQDLELLRKEKLFSDFGSYVG